MSERSETLNNLVRKLETIEGIEFAFVSGIRNITVNITLSCHLNELPEIARTISEEAIKAKMAEAQIAN